MSADDDFDDRVNSMPPRSPTPEERELQKKSRELSELEKQLVERELELETVRGGLINFETKYQAATLERYTMLDELRFRIAELRSAQNPQSPAAQAQKAVASMAAHMAMPAMPGGTPRPKRKPSPKRGESKKDAAGAGAASGFNPSEELKKLYREVAKTIHPDLADDDKERAHRHALMTRANEAYEANNAEKLAQVLSEWHHSPEAVRGEDPAAQLIRAIRKIARCEDRMAQIETDMGKLETAGIFGIKMLAEEADKFERDFLAEMTGRLDEEIEGAKALLLKMGGKIPDPAELKSAELAEEQPFPVDPPADTESSADGHAT